MMERFSKKANDFFLGVIHLVYVVYVTTLITITTTVTATTLAKTP